MVALGSLTIRECVCVCEIFIFLHTKLTYFLRSGTEVKGYGIEFDCKKHGPLACCVFKMSPDVRLMCVSEGRSSYYPTCLSINVS